MMNPCPNSNDSVSEAYHKGRIDAVVNSTDLTQRQKRKLLSKMRAPLVGEARELEQKLAPLKNKQQMLTEALKWAEEKPKTLGRAECSKLHKLLEAHRNDSIYWTEKDNRAGRAWTQINLPSAQAFVIQHDWAAAFRNATEFGKGEFQLPANPVVFEMKISDQHIAVMIGETEAESLEVGLFIQTAAGWMAVQPEPCDFDSVDDVAWSQIRAMCIALEAEVAITEVVRAPHRLNRAREKRGALPIRDYHVVSLTRRVRVPTFGETSHERRGPRLHFRRGHWRHFENHKTWVRWTLVGNPDIGFIDKEYRL